MPAGVVSLVEVSNDSLAKKVLLQGETTVNYEKKVTSDGMRIIVAPVPGARTVTVMVLVEVGSKYETKMQSGISHFTEHVTGFKGTERRPGTSDISIELDGLGCHSNAFTAEECTGYYARGNKRDFLQILDIIADLYLHPIFQSKDIEIERGVIIEEINRQDDDPEERVETLWKSLLYGNQPIGKRTIGRRSVVQRMTRDHIIAFRALHYVASATTVVVAGNVDPAEAFSEIEEKFRGISTAKKSGKKNVFDTQDEPKIAVFYRQTKQTHLRIGVRSFWANDKRNIILSVLNGVLSGGMSSRFFRNLRDIMGVCYEVGSEFSEFTDHAYFVVGAGVANDRVIDCTRAILAELQDLKIYLVEDKELDKVKGYLLGTRAANLEKTIDLALHYGLPEILRCEIRSPEEEEELIRAVTAEEIREIARILFIDKNLNLALVGPYKDEAALKSLLKF